MPEQPVSREMHIADARDMLKQVHSHLNAARQENAEANRSKYESIEDLVV